MSQLEEDNLYPVNGAYYAKEPVEQAEEHDKERDSVLAHAPQIQDAIKSLRESADAYERVYAISDELLLTDPQAAVKQLAINKGIAIGLRLEAAKLSGELEAFTDEE
jgi:hypothetical protein